MTIETFYSRISFLYGFIILFATQNYFFSKINFRLNFYETILGLVFGLSVITVLNSLIILTVQTTQTINKDKIILKNVLNLIINLVLYYSVIWCSFYLGSQMR